MQDLIYCVCEFAGGGDLHTALAQDYDEQYRWYNKCVPALPKSLWQARIAAQSSHCRATVAHVSITAAAGL